MLRGRLTLVAVGLLALLVLDGCSFLGINIAQSPPDPKNLPVPSSAQQKQVTEGNDARGHYYLTTFTTNDSASSVEDFYMSRWRPSSPYQGWQQLDSISPSTLLFAWKQTDPAYVYSFAVTTTPTTTVQTSVKIEVRMVGR